MFVEVAMILLLRINSVVRIWSITILYFYQFLKRQEYEKFKKYRDWSCIYQERNDQWMKHIQNDQWMKMIETEGRDE